jgi:hypothetical protein
MVASRFSWQRRLVVVGVLVVAATVLVLAGALVPFDLRWDISRWKRDPDLRWTQFHPWSEVHHVSDQEFDEGFMELFRTTLEEPSPRLRIEGDELVVTAPVWGHIRVARIIRLLREGGGADGA